MNEDTEEFSSSSGHLKVNTNNNHDGNYGGNSQRDYTIKGGSEEMVEDMSALVRRGIIMVIGVQVRGDDVRG